MACRRNILRAEVLYKHPGGFYAGPNVDPYALLKFRIGYDAGPGWSGYVEARNLLDTRYISSR
jgi:iron complex outermembrane receptor protein